MSAPMPMLGIFRVHTNHIRKRADELNINAFVSKIDVVVAFLWDPLIEN